MDELIAKLKALGLSDEMATSAIHTVANFVKEKTPDQFHSIIDDVLAGKSPDLGGILGNLGGLGGALGGLFKK